MDRLIADKNVGNRGAYVPEGFDENHQNHS
jgi:hypothetical protein